MKMTFLQPGTEEEGGGRVLKRSGAYLDIHVLSPSPGLGFGQPTKMYIGN